MDDETTMDHQTTPVHFVRRHISPQTVIWRLGTKLNLAKYPAYQVTNAIGVAAGLTASEVRDVNIQVRTLQNLVAATSGRESATQKLAGLRSLTLNGERHDVTAYVAAEAHHARCVVHGLPKDVPDDQLLSIISIEDREILAARRIGQSEAILLTVKGATIPKEVKVGLWLTKTQPFRPRAVQCTICLTIGHRADVCPTAHEFTRCETCGQQFPAGQQPERTAHECEPKCFNCEGPHAARDPRCPKKQQADKLARIAAEKRRLRSTPEDSAVPQKSQTSQSRATKPTNKNDENFPSLPLRNRFSALQDTTPDPQPEPRPRSGSLPGYTTKRPAPPPPPPKPKTPSNIRALLSQKSPVASEEPPHKQPRQGPSDKKSKLETLLRQISRTILGTPQYAKSDRVQGTAILPNLDELAQIHREAQFTRLKLSAQGYALLRELGYDIPPPVALEPSRPPWATLDQINVEPVPRNMDRDTQTGRREARAQHLQETTGEWILYTDASPSQTGEGFRTGIASDGLPLSWGFHYNIDRRERLDEMRNNRRVYPDPPHSMTRREAALVRRAQTHSLMTPHIEHYVQGKGGSPSCVACGGFPDNAHVLWNCPSARAAMDESLKYIPTKLRPATLEEWLADTSPDLMKALLGHLTLLGLSEG
ncbi:hypothetical protein HPB50_003352 [Hyalomma asiaticum]|uniref:Uncharacterized protein n=1 Tax=Hyalomma asiaticum TaxID=266040 RepID=A0ACB7T139_HYAAI|nr:hypothetical protein HPB50_003352 [Hyalomma asiaticum]